MKKWLIFIIVLIFYTACSKSNNSNISIIGKWEEIQSYLSPGGPTTWQLVSSGIYLEFKQDGSYNIMNKKNGATGLGSYTLNDTTISFLPSRVSQTASLPGINAHYTIKNNILEMWFDGCVEGCGSRYKRR